MPARWRVAHVGNVRAGGCDEVLQLQALLKHFVRMITAQKYRIDVTPASCTANTVI